MYKNHKSVRSRRYGEPKEGQIDFAMRDNLHSGIRATVLHFNLGVTVFPDAGPALHLQIHSFVCTTPPSSFNFFTMRVQGDYGVMEYAQSPGDTCFTPSEAKKLVDAINKQGKFNVTDVRGVWMHYTHFKPVNHDACKVSVL